MSDHATQATDLEITKLRSRISEDSGLCAMNGNLLSRILNRLAQAEAENAALKSWLAVWQTDVECVDRILELCSAVLTNSAELREAAELIRTHVASETEPWRKRCEETEGLLRLLADTAQAAESRYECPDKPLIATIKEIRAYLAKRTPAERGKGE